MLRLRIDRLIPCAVRSPRRSHFANCVAWASAHVVVSKTWAKAHATGAVVCTGAGWHWRLASVFAAALLCTLPAHAADKAPVAAAPQAATFDSLVKPFLTQYCIG